MMAMYQGFGYGFPLFGIAWMLVAVGVGVLIYGLVARAGRGEPRSTPGQPDDPLTLLKARYARGETTREEFLQLQRDITGKGGSGQ